MKEGTAPQPKPNGESNGGGAQPSTSETDGLAETVTKSVMQAISGTLSEAMKPVSEQLQSHKTTLDKIEERLTVVETAQGQTRKSASIEDVTPPATAQPATPDPEKAKRAARREQREREGLLGF